MRKRYISIINKYCHYSNDAIYVIVVCILIDAIQRKCQYCFWYNIAVVGLNEEIIFFVVSETCWTSDQYILQLYKLKR